MKEAIPLSRGGIIVHGDLPKSVDAGKRLERKRSVSEPGVSSTGDDKDLDHESLEHCHDGSSQPGELPPPAFMKSLLAYFKSLE